MSEHPTVAVRLEMASLAANVAIVRSALSGIVECIQAGPELVADLKTAISEACNNVALHAYESGESGPMIVEIDGSEAGIQVVVLDRGRGLGRISGGEDRMGLGLAVISALADRSEFGKPAGGGTEVRMWFGAPDHDGPSRPEDGVNGTATHDAKLLRLDDEILLTVSPAAALTGVLGRMLPSLAATSHFSVAKISDLRVASAAIGGYVEEVAGDGDVLVTLTTSRRRLSMIVGRLDAHDPDRARAALGSVVDDLGSETGDLRIELLDRNSGPA